MSNTKIVVFQMKEIIYTILLLLLGILFIVILVFMFHSNKKKDAGKEAALYRPGVYSSECKIGNTIMNVSVVVDENHVNAVQIDDLSDSVTTMYPLVETSMDDIEQCLQNGTDINDIQLSDENRYTKVLLLNAVEESLEKASLPKEDGLPAASE